MEPTFVCESGWDGSWAGVWSDAGHASRPSLRPSVERWTLPQSRAFRSVSRAIAWLRRTVHRVPASHATLQSSSTRRCCPPPSSPRLRSASARLHPRLSASIPIPRLLNPARINLLFPPEWFVLVHFRPGDVYGRVKWDGGAWTDEASPVEADPTREEDAPPHVDMAKTTMASVKTCVDAGRRTWKATAGTRDWETMPVGRIAPARGTWLRGYRPGMTRCKTCHAKRVVVVRAEPYPKPGDPDPNTETEKNPLDFPQVRNTSKQCSSQSTSTRANPNDGATKHASIGRHAGKMAARDAYENADRAKHKLQEWMKANPSRRPDIFPEFEPMKPPLPQPMPGDPEEPEEEEEEEEEEKEDPEEEPEEEPKPEEE